MPPRILVLASLIALLVGNATDVSAQDRREPRPFPDTSSRILVLTDQLPSRPTAAQFRFAASHYVGSQKMLRSWTRTIRKLNPGYLMLHYQLALGAGPADFVEGDAWVSDFASVTRNEAWFVHDDDGRRILQPDWGWYVMDIRFAGGRPASGFPAYWAAAAVRRMRDNENDGCFADSYTQDILIGQTRPSFSWFQSADACLADWIPHLNRFGAYCRDALHAQPESFYYLPNLGGLITKWDRTDYGIGDGGMIEGFTFMHPGRYYGLNDWQLQMGRTLTLAARGKILICQTGINAANIDERWFVVGSHLLTKGRKSYLNMIGGNGLEWYPEYDVRLGPYKDEPRGDIAEYWSADWGVYRRDFTHGLVLVNPGEAAMKIGDLGASYRLVSARGGGQVDSEGRAAGVLTAREVTSLTIPAHSARVLLR